MDLVDKIIAHEQGELDGQQEKELFSKLIKNGMAWTLQGHYGRIATVYIEDEILNRQGDIL